MYDSIEEPSELYQSIPEYFDIHQVLRRSIISVSEGTGKDDLEEKVLLRDFTKRLSKDCRAVAMPQFIRSSMRARSINEIRKDNLLRIVMK